MRRDNPAKVQDHAEVIGFRHPNISLRLDGYMAHPPNDHFGGILSVERQNTDGM